ncbi:SGNH/GDSL hydrolase family protein [Sphingomonas sp. TDK1]|uniref:SGNH/GDSL hydrolase family protein n=1 Tax=Sphingomonas sp. TDK1 TaxID=453247 RepID=UPI0007D998BA|nr:SGNH/GDSL hydrolase family protein [Sphingomonas sp. TDK1]OAN57282.1 lipolytic protein [Sphingomonas sp. TDK1]
MLAFARLVTGFALFLAPVAAQAGTHYSGLYVFGDSLVDSGNAFAGTNGAAANPMDGYFAGRFSNGFNFADYLSIAITGHAATPLAAGGLNLAVGGATAALVKGERSPSFLAQVGLYVNRVGAPIDPNALVLLTFGGNDVRDTIDVNGAVSFANALSDFSDAMSGLYALGARNFAIVGAPDIGLLPDSIAEAGSVPGQLQALSARSQQINYGLRAAAEGIDAVPGVTASYFDLFALEHALLQSPASFGLPSTLDTTTPCQILGGKSPQIDNCRNALYFDAIHPTTQVHKAIADALGRQLGISAVPESDTWVLLILGMGGIGAALRRRRASAGAAAVA